MNRMSLTPAMPERKPSNVKAWLNGLLDNHVINWSEDERAGVAGAGDKANCAGLLLAPLLNACGWQGNVLGLLDALPVTNRMLDVGSLLSIMGALGYRIDPQKQDSRTVTADMLPALFVSSRTGPCGDARASYVLRELTPYGLVWEDAEGQHRGPLPIAWDGEGILYRFHRTDAGMETAEVMSGVPPLRESWLGRIAARLQPIFWHAVFLSLAMHLFSLSMPLFSMAVYDRVISAHAPGTLPMLALGVAAAFVTETVLRAIRLRLVGWMGARAGLIICQSMFERLLFLPATLIEQASVSSQIARIRAFEAVRDFITGPMFMTLLELPFTCVLIAAIALIAGPVVLVSVGMIAAYAVLLLAFQSRWRRLGREMARTSAQRQQLALEIVDKCASIYVGGMGERMLQRFRSLSSTVARVQHAYGMTNSTVQYIAAMLTVIAAVVTINWCLQRVWNSEMTGGEMIATMIITWRLLFPLQALCTVIPNWEQVQGSAKQVSALMALTPEVHAQPHTMAQTNFTGQIDFQNVGLRYTRKTDPVFVGLNATIKHGDIYAVYGGNGCGKSSILRLILGMYPPAIGMIRLDGVDHRQLDPRALRRQIAYFPQTPEFLPGTIADNLRASNPLAANHQIRDALMWADVLETVEALPAGLETRIGPSSDDNLEGGMTLSSGLAARLSLARLYLSDRPIVLCDELPVVLLNTVTGDRFRRFIEDCRGKRTVVFVTLREDWLSMADNVIWLRQGGVPVIAKPDAMMRQNLIQQTFIQGDGPVRKELA